MRPADGARGSSAWRGRACAPRSSVPSRSTAPARASQDCARRRSAGRSRSDACSHGHAKLRQSALLERYQQVRVSNRRPRRLWIAKVISRSGKQGKARIEAPMREARGSPPAYRGARVIGTDALRLVLILRETSDGQERKQDSEDDPNINAHKEQQPWFGAHRYTEGVPGQGADRVCLSS